jgi:DNA-binding transcriptional MerR regulator
MSKQTQISLDFGPEEQPPPATAGDNGAGSDPARHYMAAGGVGVRVKSYKQTPAPGGGDLFGDTGAAPAQMALSAAKEAAVVPEGAVEPEGAEATESAALEAVAPEAVVPEVTAPVAVAPEAATEAVVPEAVAPEAEAGPGLAEIPVREADPAPLPRKKVSAKTSAARQKTPPTSTPSKRGRKSLKQVSAEADLIEIPVDEVLFSKQYYTMGEVSEMFRVNQSLLRFWESEFDILQPRKNKKGDRYFRPVDIKNLHLIYHLLRQKKYTIEGAKEFLKKNKKADERFEVVQRLQQIKAFLLEWKAQL